MNNIKKLTLLFCEGTHEPPYICRILKSDKWENKTDQDLSKYPDIIKLYISSILKGSAEYIVDGNDKINNSQDTKDILTIAMAIEKGIIRWSNKLGFLPTNILKKENHYILIFSVGGESNYNNLKNCISIFSSQQDKDNDFVSNSEMLLNIAFFYDADAGVDERIKSFCKNMKDILTEKDNFCEKVEKTKSSFSDYHFERKINDFACIGLFIFHDENKIGALEEHIIPLMENNNEEIFSQAEHFIKKHYDPNKPRPNIPKSAKTKFPDFSNYTRGNKITGSENLKALANYNKALIGITGQLQRPGRANGSIIADCDYITDEKIKNFQQAQKLIEFIQLF